MSGETRDQTLRWKILLPEAVETSSSFLSLAVDLVFVCCRNCSDRVVMLEASVDTYKRKLENLGDLKRQMKLLEENNMTYMHNTVSLEEELRKANAARAQLETYKRQVSPGTIHM